MKIGFITTKAEKLAYKFPTGAEPDFISPDPLFTPDDFIAVTHMRQMPAVTVEPILWGCPVELLKDFDVLVVRSPWDYMEDYNAFFEWLDALEASGAHVLNQPNFMKWLLDKHYLQSFADAGVSIVPTEFIEKGQPIDLEKIYKQRGAFVIKPAISAAARGLYYVFSMPLAHDYQNIFDDEKQFRPQAWLVQDFVPSVQTEGEWSLIYIDGKYSHAVHKKPRYDSILVQAERGGSLRFDEPPKAMISFCDGVMKAIPEAFRLGTGNTSPGYLLYVRLDILESESGYMLSECEAVEPELFFRSRKGSESDFADALIAHVRSYQKQK